MKPTPLALAIATMFLALTASAQSRFVTLTTGTNQRTATLTIGSNEVASVASGGGTNPYLITTKENFRMELELGRFISTTSLVQPRPLFAGPATLTLRENSIDPNAFATIEIIPESFPPGKTLIIPADTRGATVFMEASADLVHWTNSAPGIFTNSPSHLFFRLRAERIP